MPRQGQSPKEKGAQKELSPSVRPGRCRRQGYPGGDIVYDGVRYPRHDTYLWGAAADDGRPPAWLMAAETSGLDKRPLDAIQILDWLLSLPDQFGRAVFIMFSFGYDITQILKHLPYEKAWEIEKRQNPKSFMRSTRSSVLLENGETQINVLAPYRIALFLPSSRVRRHAANERRDQERPPTF